jgi:serine/threonine protein phosphatase PrpC
LDLQRAAAVSDRGHRHEDNEDAFGLAVIEDRVAAVVCDGVSTTAHPGRAAATAATSALACLEAGLGEPSWPVPDQITARLVAAVDRAQRAVDRLGRGSGVDADMAPSTTIVAALVSSDRVIVANVGDSRAYWLSEAPGDSRRLTVDDSWAEEAIASGVPARVAYADRHAHVITRWLGADSDVEEAGPHLSSLSIDQPGWLVLCTDGLWNYCDDPEQLREVTGIGDGDTTASSVAHRLVDFALAAGGNDNVTVVAVPPWSAPPLAAPDGR